MGALSAHGVFCDYLTVTCNPDDSFCDAVFSLITERFVGKLESSGQTTFFRVSGRYGPASFRFDRRYYNRVDRIAFGGAAMEVLRSHDLVGYLLQELSAVPHNVTRCDLAQDRELSDPGLYASELSRLANLGRDGSLRLGRSSLKPCKTKPMIYPRSLDGVLSGSVMLNHYRDRHSAIVYDKTAQLFDRFGLTLVPPRNTLRVEVRSTEASLRDVIDPDPLFFYLASPDLVSCPPSISGWVRQELLPMNLPPIAKLSDYQRAMALVDESFDLKLLCDLLASASNLELSQMVRRRLDQRIDAAVGSGASDQRKTA